MKVAFITIHVGFNFGSKMQTIATFEIIKKLGLSPICVNYIPPRVTNKRYWKNAIQDSKLFRRLFLFPFILYSKHLYDNYLKKHCDLSKPIYATTDFTMDCPKADVYISGSDQIWNYKHNEGIDKHYFFDGIKGKKIAYASSIGMTDIPNDYAEYMKSQLSGYSAISVRESTAVSILKEMGIKSTLVLDPTFMLNRDDWKKYSSKRLVDESYLFVYLPYNIVDKAQIYRSVKKVAKQKDLKIVTYSDFFIKEIEADITITFVTPGDILSLFYYADFVITNSFHGTAFSINLNKEFYTYLPSSFSTRIISLLKLCNIENRLLKEEISTAQIDENINYDKINRILEDQREKTINFLTDAMQ